MKGSILAAMLLVALAACGQPAEEAADSPEPTPGTQDAQVFSGCTVGDPALESGRELVEADLDGDGSPDRVTLLGPGDGGCADALVAWTGDGVIGMSLDGLELDASTARAVQLTGAAGQLVLVDGAPHPRGGHQPHLFGVGRDGMAEVLVDGNPVIPFIATDGGALPGTARCTEDGGIEVLSATTHLPPGVVHAWDVQRTSYDVEGTVATRTGTKMVREAAADPLLRKEMPQLFQPEKVLADCTVG